jgi:elongator complex protein 1
MEYEQLLGEAGNLLPHLLQFTDEYRGEGQRMQQRVTEFGEELKKSLEEVWYKPPEEITPDTWATRMEEIERERKTNPIDKISKPIVGQSDSDWRINLYDFQ